MASKDIEVTLKGVRLSFENVFKPKAYKNKQTGVLESYALEGAFLIDKVEQADQIKTVTDAMAQALRNEWGDSKPLIPAENRCARQGEVVDPDTGEKVERYSGYAGKVVLNAKRKIRLEDVDANGKLTIPSPVQVLGPRKTDKDPVTGRARFPRLNGSEGLIYSGCYVDAVVRIYAYNGQKDNNPNRINASLEAIKFVRHGEAFGAKPIDADSAFEEEDGDEGDDMLEAAAPAAAKQAALEDDLLG